MFKKLQYLFGLVVFGICLSTHGFDKEQFELKQLESYDQKIEVELDYILDHTTPKKEFYEKHSQNITAIFKEIGKAVAVELNHILYHITPNEDYFFPIDLDQVEKLINQELPAIKTKIAHVTTHDLTKEQRALVINLLENCKALSATTVDDLMLMAQILMSFKTGPSDYTEASFNNAFKKIMVWNYVYIDNISLMVEAEVDLNDDKQALLVQQCCIHILSKIVMPFHVFNNFDFLPGWEREFEKVGKVFLIMNTICSELLEAIKH